MSSLRNAVKRITHKERSQPQARAHLGILEKKKDYRVRARDYHRKEDRIKSLRTKAAMRNPDEFYFGMNRSQVVDGSHRKTNEARMEELKDQVGPDAVRIMKDQDLTYVRLHRQRDEKKLEKLQSSLHFLGSEETAATSEKKHTIFVEDESQSEKFDVAEHFQTLPELAGRSFNRPKVQDIMRELDAGEADSNEDPQLTAKQLKIKEKETKKTARKAAKARAAAYNEFELRSKRKEALALTEAHLVTEKQYHSKGRKRKIKDAEDGRPAVYKWRRRRAG